MQLFTGPSQFSQILGTTNCPNFEHRINVCITLPPQIANPCMVSFRFQLQCCGVNVFITVMSYEQHSVTNHQQLDCLFNSLFRGQKINIKAPHYWPFVRGIHVDSLTKGQ